MVPMIEASRTFSVSVAMVSAARATAALRLQNCIGRSKISPHGFVPNSAKARRSGARLRATVRENSPGSPFPEVIISSKAELNTRSS